MICRFVAMPWLQCKGIDIFHTIQSSLWMYLSTSTSCKSRHVHVQSLMVLTYTCISCDTCLTAARNLGDYMQPNSCLPIYYVIISSFTNAWSLQWFLGSNTDTSCSIWDKTEIFQEKHYKVLQEILLFKNWKGCPSQNKRGTRKWFASPERWIGCNFTSKKWQYTSQSLILKLNTIRSRSKYIIITMNACV